MIYHLDSCTLSDTRKGRTANDWFPKSAIERLRALRKKRLKKKVSFRRVMTPGCRHMKSTRPDLINQVEHMPLRNISQGILYTTR